MSVHIKYLSLCLYTLNTYHRVCTHYLSPINDTIFIVIVFIQTSKFILKKCFPITVSGWYIITITPCIPYVQCASIHKTYWLTPLLVLYIFKWLFNTEIEDFDMCHFIWSGRRVSTHISLLPWEYIDLHLCLPYILTISICFFVNHTYQRTRFLKRLFLKTQGRSTHSKYKEIIHVQLLSPYEYCFFENFINMKCYWSADYLKIITLDIIQ